MDNCIFCKIVAKQIPASVVYEDDEMLALAPKLAEEHGVAVKVDGNGARTGGFKTLINSGPDGGQEVYHLHLHMYGGKRPWRGLGT